MDRGRQHSHSFEGLGDAAGGLVAGAGLEAGASAADVGAVSVGLDTVSLSAEGLGALLGLLKSVTYQPLPLSWNPAAVTCLLNVAAPQAVQFTSTGSEIFRRMSCEWPQVSHR